MTDDPKERFSNWEPPTIEHGKLTEYNWVVHHPKNLELAEYVDIGAFTVINAHSSVKIEENVQIGPHCDLHSKSTIDGTEGKITVREGANIGSHTTVLPGVDIGKNATVGSHSLVNEDVPDDSLVVGVPAKEK